MGWFSKKEVEKRETWEELLLSAGVSMGKIDVSNALNIPTVSACVNLISNTIAMLPIKLYKDEEGKIISVNDNRIKLLNDETKDTLDGFQFKFALIRDYILEGAGYAYINKYRNNVKSLNYVEKRNVAVNMGVDPIYKNYDILVNGVNYKPFDFIKITRNSKNGVQGSGIVIENEKMLSVAYNSLVFEDILVSTGGNKKGFLKSEKSLAQEAINALKTAWANLYKNNSENVIVLNNGLEFQEASNTSVEMQLNENKKTNAIEICKIFNVPPSLLEGKATEEEYNNFIKLAILPILKAFETALNKDLLLETEKQSFYFAFDTKELLKGDIEKRYKAYEIACKNGIMQIDEIRYLEDLEPMGLEFIKLGLQDVLYNPKTKEIYTPNTNKTANIEGGGINESGDKK